jgi:hypothetical protein
MRRKESIETDAAAGLRDCALITLMFYTFGAVGRQR